MSIRRLAFVAAAAFAALHGNARAQAACSNTSGTIRVPAGFCITKVADSLANLRHFAIAPNGDMYAAEQRGGLFVLHDTNKDGVYDTRKQLYAKGGNDVVLHGANTIYYTPNDAVVRIRLNGDNVVAVDTIVEGLPTSGNHTTKSIAFTKDGALLVDMGSATNSCQVADRSFKSPGKDPCVELETRAGIWKFDANALHQKQTLDKRYATGLRNVVALTSHPTTGLIYGVQHGRDQLGANWGFTDAQNAELPSEIMAQINQGDDFGWPFCYYDHQQGKHVLAPEYGGDGKEVGRCASKKAPVAGYPGHWAPESIVFYTGTQFPAEYRGGAFIAFHGSWNRSPLPQAGFRVIYQPMRGTASAGAYKTFVDGFLDAKLGNSSERPMGLAVGPDGSLYVGSDTGGKVWKITAARGR